MFSNVDLALGFQLSLFSRIKFDFEVKSNLIHFPLSKTIFTEIKHNCEIEHKGL